MLTPTFRCRQDGKFVIVEILIPSIHCKLSTAEFDITDTQFTFYASPYYLRLTFQQWLEQGKGERATYDLSTNALTVYLPKAIEGQQFVDLDFPQKLLATRKQRIEILSSTENTGVEASGISPAVQEEDSDDEEAQEEEEDAAIGRAQLEEETEFVQELPAPWPANTGGEGSAAKTNNAVGTAVVAPASEESAGQPNVFYGFNNAYTNFFSRLDRSTMDTIVELPEPDSTPSVQRRALREQDEDIRFDEGAVFDALCDEDGEVQELLGFKPTYVQQFEKSLRENGVRFLQRQTSAHRSSALNIAVVGGGDASGVLPEAVAEESEVPIAPADAAQGQGQGGKGTVVTTWSGNVMSLESEPQEPPTAPPATATSGGKRLIEEIPSEGDAMTRRRADEEHEMKGTALSTGLACPRQKPDLEFTMEEASLLARLPSSTLPGASSTTRTIQSIGSLVDCLLVDLLCAYTYDHLVTKGEGSVESIWTLTKLSPSLSWLDTGSHLYDTCVAFVRRVLVFPQHRSFDLAMRCLRDVGILLLSGRNAVLRPLLFMKHIFDHSETQYSLSTLFLNPLLSYLCEGGVTAAGDSGGGASSMVDRRLESIASLLHGIATANEPLAITRPALAAPEQLDPSLAEVGIHQGSSAHKVMSSIFGAANQRGTGTKQSSARGNTEMVPPLAPLTVRLPFSELVQEEEQE